MNIWKWFLYVIALSAFIGFIFFREVAIDGEIVDEDTQATSTPEETEISQDTDTAEEYYAEDDIVQPADEYEIEDPTTEQSTSNDTEYTGGNTSINTEARYLIVIGSFGVKANANRLMKTSIDKGQNAKIKYINGLHRVIVASAESELQAENIKEYFLQKQDVSSFILEP